jgi:para-nitrobenzyl esterase
MRYRHSLFLLPALLALAGPAAAQDNKSVPVTVGSFARAESDLYFGRAPFGRMLHQRAMANIDAQAVVRMNRDTLYSSGVFDLDAGPVTITLPEAGSRYMSVQAVSEDHYAVQVGYPPGRFTFTRDAVGTRYVDLIVRTLANPEDAQDLRAANALQDQIRVEQAGTGTFQVPAWDKVSQDRIRGLLNQLAAMRGGDPGQMFGTKAEVDPIAHLIGTAVGWGGNSPAAAIYVGVNPPRNDGQVVHRLVVRDVPVDGFWSISVYDRRGYFVRNAYDAYSVNSLTAKKAADGSAVIQFGGCDGKIANCLPVMPGWNYTVRLYRPRAEILSGAWKFPAAVPID